MASSHRPDQSENGEVSGDQTTRRDLPDLGDGRYAIQELVGEGGMGRVYRAVDRQLDRTVAIKAIRPSLASKPEVVKRLAREAKFAAQLDHPFICKVHELIQRDDGQALLVMEFVEGETLKAVLKTVPLDLSSVVRLARELADALGFAHQRGLIHRDIKPANIIMTLPGHIKVMDFGVAKALDADISATSTLTEHGHVVGTPAYMSPEQAAGEPIDHRSDIFSFGVLVYECISGHLPFQGSTAAAYLRDAALAQPKPLPRHVPAELRAIVLRCLAKSPGDRYESFDAVRKDLDAASLSLISATSDLTFAQRLRLGPRWWVAALLLGIVVVGGYFLADWLKSSDAGEGHVLVQRPIVTWPSIEDGSRISPDGTVVSFVSNQGGAFRLWIRSASGNDPKPITGVHEGIKTPAWSSNGQQIAYLFRDKGRTWLEIVSVWGESAGPPQPMDGAWDDLGLVRWIGARIYFSVSAGRTTSVLWRHDTARRVSEQVTHEAGKRFTATGMTINIDVRRDETRIVFVAAQPDEGLWTADLDGRNAVRLAIDSRLVVTPRWRGPSGKRVVYISNENGQADIWEYALDTRTRTALTTSPLEEEVVDVSESGRVMVADTVEQVSHLWSVDPGSTSPATQLTSDSLSDLWPSVSASTGRVVYHRRQPSFVAYALEDTDVMTARWVDRRLEPGARLGPGSSGALSSDGRRVFFVRWVGGATGARTSELWVKDLDSPDAGRRIEERFWFGGNDIATWSVAHSVAWGPRGSDDLFFARQVPSAESAHELVRAKLGNDLTPTVSVLATVRGELRWFDPTASENGALLAVVEATRRPFRGGAVRLFDLSRPSLPPTTVFESGEGAWLFVRGWTRRGTLLVLKSLRPDKGNATEVWEVDPRGRGQRVAVVPGLLAITARFDAARDRLFAAVVERGLATVRVVSLAGGGSRTIVPNTVDGIAFGGYAVTPDGWLLYTRKETNYDVWVFDFADRERSSASQGGQK
jgi:serine/threonine protein kinase